MKNRKLLEVLLSQPEVFHFDGIPIIEETTVDGRTDVKVIYKDQIIAAKSYMSTRHSEPDTEDIINIMYLEIIKKLITSGVSELYRVYTNPNMKYEQQ